MSRQYIEVGYALSGRVKCQGCQGNIPKGEIRIGHVYLRPPASGFDKKLWYHLNCFNSIKGERGQNLDIANMDKLEAKDKQKVIQKIEQVKNQSYLKKNQKDVKYLSKQEHFKTYVKDPRQAQFNSFQKQALLLEQRENKGEDDCW